MKRLWDRIISLATRSVTILFVPNSGGGTRRTRLNFLTIGFALAMGLGVLFLGGYLLLRIGGTLDSVPEKQEALRETQATLESARTGINELLSTYADYSTRLSAIIAGAYPGAAGQTLAADGLAAVLDTGSAAGGLSEEAQLRHATQSLVAIQGPLLQVVGAVELQQQILQDLPTQWPVINGLGRTSLEFGPNVHPVLKIWYMHRGIDIAFSAGTPVVAAGNGVVVDVGWDKVSGYGGFVEIEHPFGFVTKYAHLGAVRVTLGESVTQGQTIGLLGNSGISTGPHVHYEVTIGSEVVDPALLLKLGKPDFARRTTHRY